VERGAHTVQLASGTVQAVPKPCIDPVPTVGDWCAVEPTQGPALLHQTLPRRSQIVRKAAGRAAAPQALVANVDTVFLVCGLDRDQGLRSIERLLTIVLDGGATPVILLNKVDLCDDLAGAVLAAESAAPGFEVLAVSATQREGLEQLGPHLVPGRTLALLGPSGAGKSTLINALAGEVLASTGAVRARDRRGRHTTTSRQLYQLPRGGILVDTPGLRELGTWLEADGLEQAFADITELAAGCRFRDCSHDTEPGCRVRAALLSGELETRRFHRYLELTEEANALVRRRSEKERGNSKRRFKDITKFARQLYKEDNPRTFRADRTGLK
jgi:ribosome biogenesis GTPase